jgi:(1->4)-alpha-D-glucan 1-alpha-D-glucosylmutase
MSSLMWDFSLVDPHNRRAVDYAQRREVIDQLETLDTELAGRVRLLLENPEDGRLKLYLTRCILHLRHGYDALFREGT